MIVPASDWRRPHPARRHESQESGVGSHGGVHMDTVCASKSSPCANAFGAPARVVQVRLLIQIQRGYLVSRSGWGREGVAEGGADSGAVRGARCAGSSYRRCAWGAECIPRIGEKRERWAMERTAPPLAVTQVRGPGDDRVPPAVPRARDGGPVWRLLCLEAAQELE